MRIAITAIGFVAFALFCVALTWIALPLSRRFGRSDLAPDLAAQRQIHRFCRGFLDFVQRLGVLRWEALDAAALSEPGARFIVANHPTLLDFVAIAALMPQADCIVNSARADNPLLARIAAHARYVRNDGGADVIRACAERLRAGRNLVVFPEGTRSPASGLREFQRGVARIALEADCDLQPIVIHCDPPTLRKGQKWYDVPARPFRLTLRVLDPLGTQPIRAALRDGRTTRSSAARQLTAELREVLAKAKTREAERTGGGDVGTARS
jgi:1-acyl-sn-glycerol-3-phosphate acyltransferase